MPTLIESFDAVLSDLDGVIYAGPAAIDHAVQALEALAPAGVGLAFVTNNASRTPGQVAAHLRELGVPAEESQVVSSPQAAADLLAQKLAPGSRVMITGSTALADEVRSAGLEPVFSADDDPAAVVQGFDPSLGWKDLAEATYAIRAGAWWVATNTDLTIPQARGIAPGNGTLVAAVQTATGIIPEVAGKPEPPLFHAAARRLGSTHPVVVGDRLDTDLLGANRAGYPGILVLTGVNTAEDALWAVPDQRPQFIINNLSELHQPYEGVSVSGEWTLCGPARAQVTGEHLRIEGVHDGDLRGWRAACAALWSAWPDSAPELGERPTLSWA